MKYEHILKSTKERFQTLYKERGYSKRSLGWSSDEKINKRFEALFGIGIKPYDSVLDVGCGFGWFYKFLSERILVDYVGIDIVPEFIEKCKRYDEGEKVIFVTDSLFNIPSDRRYDWVVESGIFNFKDVTDEYIVDSIKKAYKICNKGVAFNFMSTYVDFTEDQLHYTNPLKVFELAKSLSRHVVLKHDYMNWEFTIYIYKDDDDRYEAK